MTGRDGIEAIRCEDRMREMGYGILGFRYGSVVGCCIYFSECVCEGCGFFLGECGSYCGRWLEVVGGG